MKTQMLQSRKYPVDLQSQHNQLFLGRKMADLSHLDFSQPPKRTSKVVRDKLQSQVKKVRQA